MEMTGYESLLEGVSSKEEIKPIVDYAYEDGNLSENDIYNIKNYAQVIYDKLVKEEDFKDFEREEAERHQEDYMYGTPDTDDELGLTQM